MRIRIYPRLVLLCFICLTHSLFAQNINGNSHFFNEESKRFFCLQERNPALYYKNPVANYTDVLLGWNSRRSQDKYLIQEGNSQNIFRFDANSFVKKEKEIYFGSAVYENGVNKNQKWNSVADYTLLAPYIIADTVGGDAKFDTYFFEGAYAAKYRKISWGLYGSYKAGVSYRALDPRPKNTTSDFQIKAGLAFKLIQNYDMGLGLGFRSYDQESNLKNFREKGTGKVFFMRGLGLSETYFSTVTNLAKNYYDLSGMELSLQFYPDNGDGYFVNTKLCFDKMTLENSYGYRTVAESKKTALEIEAGYNWTESNIDQYLKIFVDINSLNGWEYNYTANGQVLNKSQQYTRSLSSIGLAYLRSVNHESCAYFIQFSSRYQTETTEHKSPLASRSINKGIAELSGGIRMLFRKSALAVKLRAAYSADLNSNLETSFMAVANANTSLVEPNFAFLSATYLHLQSQVRYDFTIGRKTSLFAYWVGDCYSFAHAQASTGFNLALGLTF